MKKRVGVWVDTEKAVIISLEENEHRMKIVHSQPGKRLEKAPKLPKNVHSIVSSSIDGKLRIPGDTKEFSRSGSNHYSTELKNEHKLKNTKNQYFRSILNEIKDVDEVVLFGPSMTKKELESQMAKYPQIHSHLRAVKSADMLSDNQMVRWVENYFLTEEESPKKS